MFDFLKQLLSKLPPPSQSESPIKVLMNGLDAAGKTSILYSLAHHRDGAVEDVMPTKHCPKNDYRTERVTVQVPTIGFQVETMKRPLTRMEVTCWDVGGPDRIRPLWRHYYKGADAFVFVVDSNDVDRIEQAGDEMHRALQEEELRGVPLLVLANKRDLPFAVPLSDARKLLRLDSLTDRRWRIHGTCAGGRGREIGIHEGFEWIVAGCPNLTRPLYDLGVLRALFAQGRASIRRGAKNEDVVNVVRFLCEQPPELCERVESFLGTADRRVTGLEFL